jgi:hypothetical protein
LPNILPHGTSGSAAGGLDDDVDELFCDEMTTQRTGGAQTYKTENW